MSCTFVIYTRRVGSSWVLPEMCCPNHAKFVWRYVFMCVCACMCVYTYVSTIGYMKCMYILLCKMHTLDSRAENWRTPRPDQRTPPSFVCVKFRFLCPNDAFCVLRHTYISDTVRYLLRMNPPKKSRHYRNYEGWIVRLIFTLVSPSIDECQYDGWVPHARQDIMFVCQYAKQVHTCIYGL